jgi:antitoxin component YwqK of YwqJK toxin-antitoxin module
MKIFFGLLALLIVAVPLSFAQINPARMYEQQRGTQSPVEGVWHVYDRNGKLLREENYHNYRLDGEMKIYYPSGALKEVLHYSDGLREGNDKAYFENGGLEREENYKDNDLEGESMYYYDTGEVKSRGHYTNGKLEGSKTIYYKNGNVKQSMEYLKGILEGPNTTYADNGSVIVEEHYTHGNLISHNEYGDKAHFESKSDTATKEAVAPAPNTEPAAPDAPTKL